MSSVPSAPARVHVLLARKAPLGVVIRRGPSKHVCTLLWNRRHDTFTLGQWLKGRVYERRSDLSPDGKYLIYFAMSGQISSETGGAWTAISRAPYLKAIGLWRKGDTWHGGGLFLDDGSYWINGGDGHEPLRVPQKLVRASEYPAAGENVDECVGVYYPRLRRDGWRLAHLDDDIGDPLATTLEKPIGGGWILRKLVYAAPPPGCGHGHRTEGHQLVHTETGSVGNFPLWEWADLDGDRLVWSEGGRLLAGRMKPDGLAEARELFDFNGMHFERVAAPY